MIDPNEATPIPRRIPFEFPEDIDPRWIPGDPEMSAMVNGASLGMPYLEPFLIRTIRESMEHVDDPKLRADMAAFNAQEGQHFRAHRRFNDLIKAKGYPELGDIEARMEASYAKLSKRPLKTRLAYTAGFEAMTLGLTKWLVEDRVRLFAGADSRVVSLVLWHMVEETEHKRVAHDAYEAVFGSTLFGGYFARMIGVFHGSFHLLGFSMQAYKTILRKDGLWYDLRSRLRLASRLWRFVRHVGPYLLRATVPGHNPRRERDPEWVIAWINGYTRTQAPGVPLLDTSSPDMPVPFPVMSEGAAA